MPPTHPHYKQTFSPPPFSPRLPCCSDVLPPLRILGILYGGSSSGGESHGGSAGASGEAGVGECGGDLQPQLLLHVPCREEALLRNGREPDCVRAGPGPQREGDWAGVDEAAGELSGGAGGVHRGEARGVYGQCHGFTYQWDSGPSPQGSRSSLALILKVWWYWSWSGKKRSSEVASYLHFCFSFLDFLFLSVSM